MARILQYIECPQYLRKDFFPHHDDLKYVGLLNPLDAPHHLRHDEECLYREGVVLEPADKKKKRPKSSVNVGLMRPASITGSLEPMSRVTVKFDSLEGQKHGAALSGAAVPCHTPRTEAGIYWGYDVRLAETFSAVFCQSPHDDGYDLTIGISSQDQQQQWQPIELPSFEHAIVVFPGVQSLERILQRDDKLQVKEADQFFDVYVNTSPSSSLSSSSSSSCGAARVRSEESLLISLSMLRPKLAAAASLQ